MMKAVADWWKPISAFVLVTSLWAGIIVAAWRVTESFQYVNERVATCTIIEKENADIDSFPPVPAVVTAQCGKLTFKQGPTRATTELYRRLDVGSTYRLRIADIQPPQAEAAIAIAGIEGKHE